MHFGYLSLKNNKNSTEFSNKIHKVCKKMHLSIWMHRIAIGNGSQYANQILKWICNKYLQRKKGENPIRNGREVPKSIQIKNSSLAKYRLFLSISRPSPSQHNTCFRTCDFFGCFLLAVVFTLRYEDLSRFTWSFLDHRAPPCLTLFTTWSACIPLRQQLPW